MSNNKIKILFINPSVTRSHDMTKEKMRLGLFYHLGLGYIISNIESRSSNYEIIFYDALLDEVDENGVVVGDKIRYGATDERIRDKIESVSPDIVGVSCLFPSSEIDAINIIKITKDLNGSIKTIMGGVHPSNNAPYFMKAYPEIDHIVLGEGEIEDFSIPYVIHNVILPEYFEKTYFHWVENLRDWCVSRQIWYGHRIPVWYKGEEVAVGEAPTGDGWVQDEDTLDTWFSSGLWTFSTLGWPEDTKDKQTYHPTDLIETGYDILFFWIARMILMTEFTLGTIPFKTVYLHGLVRDAQGRKMSKSLGNNLDPLDIAAKFGADAARMALIVGNTPGTDMRMSEDKIKGYKHFANKLWNIARYVLSQVDKFDKSDKLNKELKEEFDDLAKDVTNDMENFRFYIAAEKIYHYIWHRFADEILEESKKNPELPSTIHYLLENSLKLLHPFMPFITEEIWQELKHLETEFPSALGNSVSKSEPRTLLMIEPWPFDKAQSKPAKL